MGTLLQDLRYGLRMLRKNPGFTAVAVLTLALGIGANTAIFSFVDLLVLRPLPFPESDRLVSLYQRDTRNSAMYDSVSYPDYVFYRDHATTLSGLGVFSDVEVALRIGDHSVRVSGEIVSYNYFSVLGVSPHCGRWFLPDEDAVPGRNPALVLGYGLWQRDFAADPGVIGRSVFINGVSFTIVGVAPRGFAGSRLDRPAKPGFWVPTMMYPVVMPQESSLDLEHLVTDQWLSAVGRMKTDVTLAQAEAEFANLTEQLKRTLWRGVWKSSDGPMRSVGILVPSDEARIDPASRATVRIFLIMLMAVVGLVLLIACSNVASLMLSRNVQRSGEIGVRLALGAGKRRLLQQLLTESLLITLMGGIAGLVLAMFAARALGDIRQPFHMPLLLEPSLDLRVLLFSMALTLLTGVLFGVLPLGQSSRLDLVAILKPASGFHVGRSRSGVQKVLVTMQAALSVILLTGAVLFVHTLRNAEAADPTQDPGSVLLMSVNTAERNYDEVHGKQFYSELLGRVRALLGVRRAALVYVVPMGGWRGGTDVVPRPGASPVQVDFNVVSDDYFQTVGLPLLRGRAFGAADREGSPAVAIVNEQMAQRFWPGEDPLGKQIRMTNSSRLAEIIGIVRDGRFRNYRAQINPCLYVPFAQNYVGTMSLEVRAAGDPMPLVAPVRREIWSLDKEMVPGEVWTLKSFRDAVLGQERLSAALLSGFGVLALALAAIGLYGLLSFAVARRTHEIGIRMALGANPGDVLKQVVGQGLSLMLIGVGLGMLGALALTRFLTSLLFGVEPNDPLSLAIAAALLTSLALLACYLPARQATKVDPMAALRYE